MIDESKYPMTYEEYEKRVIELYLDGISEDHTFMTVLIFMGKIAKEHLKMRN